MTITTNIKVLKCLMAIRLDVNIWSARKKLIPSDFGATELPPEKLASLGSKKICNPKELCIFGTLKSRAISLLDKNGVRFLGGWALPEQKVEEIQNTLLEIAADFNDAKELFLNRYDESVQEWIRNNPGWESLIASSAVSSDYVRSRLDFNWQMFKIMPPSKKNEAVSSGLQGEVENLGVTLFGEVAKIATDSWHNSFAGKDNVTRKALAPLRSVHRKLSGLSFIEPRVSPVITLLETAFSKIPAKGRIRGANLIMLQGLLCLLRDPSALVEHGQKIIEGNTPDKVLQNLLSNQDTAHGPQVESASFANEQIDDLPESVAIPAQPAPLNSLGLW
ncbi:DUF3150 domain-containing protein [Maridesulfovibrio ferrireducens]|uniref:DUF3150 domain-containing protein n=1 Tax=Maridesulfovibrio ferrireducens TaxID=246191 RepID=UPI001A1B60CC|nr:DUF3150 domain-containing protein [Maridesulfovibrio ferrireducens]MBI9109957.1 DUF3150 domain-containing protein [Maridesulfovibrio ferrireducens]